MTSPIDGASPPNVKGEHIFPATIVEGLATKWKQLVKEAGEAEKAGEHQKAAILNSKAAPILEDIILKSSDMFSRLAQYEGYHNTVDLPTLISAAQAKLSWWLLYWDPAKGKLFSWLSKCAKHVFLGEVIRASRYNKHHFPTSDNIEKFFGTVDHEVDSREALESVQDTLRDLSSRWSDPQILCCIRYHIACIVENPDLRRKDVILAGAYASGLSHDLSKFFFSWALFALRDAMYDKLNPGYTEQDLLRLEHSYTYLPDLLTVITWEQMLRLISVLGGTRIKIPTLQQLAQLKADHILARQIDRGHRDPESIARIAKKNNMSAGTAEEIYRRTLDTWRDDRSHEVPLYE